MTAQLETQDTEIQDVAEEIRGTLEGAFDLLIERRENAFADAMKPLDAERDALKQESASISEARVSLERLLPARARVAQSEADALTLAGKHEEATAKLAEAGEAAGAPAAMIERQQQISVRIEALQAEKQAAARRIFRTWYSECQAIIRPIEHGLFVTILDGLRQSFLDFQNETSTAVRLGDITDLTAGERSPEWLSGNRWYGGR